MSAAESMPVSPAPSRASARTRSIWLWQLSLGAVIVIVTLAVLVLEPQALAEPARAAGTVLIMGLTVLALLVPWDRVGKTRVALLPLADIIGIGLISIDGELWFGSIWVFPLAWFATHFGARWLVFSLFLVTGLIVLDAVTHGPSAFTTLRFLVVLLSLTFISITIYNSARRSGAFTRLLRRQSERLEDTLERVRAQERRVNQVLNGLDSGIARIDREGRLLGVNEAYVALYGIDVRDTSRPGTSIEYDARGGTALREQDRPAARASRGDIFSDEQLWLFDAEGRWHTLSASTRELARAAGEPDTTLLVVRDVTEAVEAEAARRTLATTVTHELANPLTAIVGYTDLLLEDDLPPRSRERLELIEAAGERMERLISEVLRAGGRDPAGEEPHRRVDARALLASSVESFRPAATSGDVTLTLTDGPSTTIVGNAFRLRQVFDNVISNAVKYTPRAGTVTARIDIDGADALVIVRDSGIGIGAQDLPHIFDDYFRAETARDAGLPGTGLGMGISRRIVEQHGGTLEIDSLPGAGTTVTVRLPLAAPEADEQNGPS